MVQSFIYTYNFILYNRTTNLPLQWFSLKLDNLAQARGHLA